MILIFCQNFYSRPSCIEINYHSKFNQAMQFNLFVLQRMTFIYQNSKKIILNKKKNIYKSELRISTADL